MRELAVMVPFRESHRALIGDAAGAALRVTYLPEDLPAREQAGLLRHTEVVIGEPELGAICASETLRWVQMTWSGTDKYTRCGSPFPGTVRLTNMSGAFGPAMSEYAISAILALFRRLPEYHRSQAGHLWRDMGSERMLSGKTALIYGAGDVGTRTAEKLRAFGTVTIGVRRHTGEKPACFDHMCALPGSEAWLPQADIVICCIPGSGETDRFLDGRRLRLMKKDALLVNMGRGGFVVTDALAELLAEGHLWGAALDVTDPEPLPAGHPLWDMKNVILTPHIAGASFGHCPETEDRIAAICCENLRRYLAGKALRNLVL